MLIQCPECEKQVSDRADACPGCGFPIAKELEKEREAEARAAEIASRERSGNVDCVVCEARGFVMMKQDGPGGVVQSGFKWCSVCEHTGRVALVRSTAGYYAVADRCVERFVAGELESSLDGDDDRLHALGTEKPAAHRYPQAGKRVPYDDD